MYLFERSLLALGRRGRRRWQTIRVVRVCGHVLRDRTRRIGGYLDMLLRVQGRLSGSCANRLGRNDERRTRRVGRHMLLRHGRDVGVRVVLLMRILLPARILLRVLLGIEGHRRAMVVCVGIDRRLRRRRVHVVVVLLLAARLFVVWDRVARAHVVVIVHGDGGDDSGAGAEGSRRQRWRLAQGGRSYRKDVVWRLDIGQHGWSVCCARWGEEGAAGCWSSFPEAAMLALTSDESLSRVSVWLPLRAPVCQQCRMLLPLAPRAQGAMRSSFGDDKRLARGWARCVGG